MKPWLVRALFLVLAHVAVRTGLELLLGGAPSYGPFLRYLGVALLVALALVWAGLDAVGEDLDDPERDYLSTRWFLAALVAGPLAGLIGWALQGLLVDATGPEQLGFELTGGAAFTALLVLAPALLGLYVGGRLRPAQPEPELYRGPARTRRAGS